MIVNVVISVAVEAESVDRAFDVAEQCEYGLKEAINNSGNVKVQVITMKVVPDTVAVDLSRMPLVPVVLICPDCGDIMKGHTDPRHRRCERL